MENKCPKCGKSLPEEASFCLYCFTDIEAFSSTTFESGGKNEPVKAAFKEKKKLFLGKTKLKSNKRAAKYVCAAVLFLIFTGACVAITRNANFEEPRLSEGDTVIVKETQNVAVTMDDGAAVTDADGDQVFELVEVTRVESVAVTEKQNVFDKIFKPTQNKNTSDNGTSSTAATTQEPGFFQQLFGKDEPSSSAEDTTLAFTETTQKSESTTAPKPSEKSEDSTASKPSETATEPFENYQNAETPITDFEYKLSEKYAAITGYKGTAKHVTVPAVVEGKYVTSINKFTFSDNSTVETVSFADDGRRPYLWVYGSVFNNCSSLREVNFPDTDLGIYGDFAVNCPSIEKLSLKNMSQFRYKDGGLYYTNGKTWRLRYYCPAYPSSVLTLPSWATEIESNCNLCDAVGLKEINLHEAVEFFNITYTMPPNLENIFVSDSNPYGYDINGIAFNSGSSGRQSCVYPPKNKTTELTLPENAFLECNRIKNPYLKTIRIPKSANLTLADSISARVTFSSLETVYLESGSANESTLRKGMYDLKTY